MLPQNQLTIPTELKNLQEQVNELKSKNLLLEEHNALLKENIKLLEEEKRKQDSKNIRKTQENKEKTVQVISGNTGKQKQISDTDVPNRSGDKDHKTRGGSSHHKTRTTTDSTYDLPVPQNTETSKQDSQATLPHTRVNPNDSDSNISLTDDDNDFVFPRRKRNRRRSGRQHSESKQNGFEIQIKQTRRKLKPQFGTRDDNGADFGMDSSKKDRKIWIFLSRVRECVSEEKIREYVAINTKCEKDEVSVKICNPKVTKSMKKRFMVGVNPEYKDLVYSGSFWPKGIGYQRFNFSLGKNFLDRERSAQSQT